MSLRQIFRGLGERPAASKRSKRSLRPGLEGLEKREVMTVAFTPAFGAETIDWRTSVAGHAAGSAFTGPVSNPTALNNPTVYLIFSGTSWTSATATKYANDVKTILASPYLSGLTQYGASGTAVYGDYAIDNRTSPGSSGRDAEIQYALDTLKPGWQKPGTVNTIPGSNLSSPIYVVIDDNGNSGASNGGGVYAMGGKNYGTNGININNGTNEDTFTDLFSHELVERISDGTGAGVSMYAPVDVSGESQNAQIADNEPDGGRYTYRLGGTVKVQAYWSVVDQKFIIPDGNQQTITLKPIWNGLSFTNTFDLLAVQSTPTDAAPTAQPLNTAKTQLTLGNETFNFSTDPIRNVSVFTLYNNLTTGVVYHNAGPGTSWTALTGVYTPVSALVTNGTTVDMLANYNNIATVWQYSGSGNVWSTITGGNTIVPTLVASGNSFYMLANNGGVNQVWRYNNSGTNWTAITGTNTNVSELVSSASGLDILANNGGANQVWDYSGAGTNWTAITGTDTHVAQLVSTGSTLDMIANNGGVNQVWDYSGVGTNWGAISGTNTSVTQLIADGDSLFMSGNNGTGINVTWRYNGSGTNWTAITGTNTPVYELFTYGDGLFMITTAGNVAHVWEYSGSANIWLQVS